MEATTSKQASRFSRPVVHLGAMMLAALGNPLIKYDTQPVFTWLTTWLSPLIVASVAYGIYLAVARQRAKSAWTAGFFGVAWVVLVIVVVSPYMERAKRAEHVAPAAHANQTADAMPGGFHFDPSTARKVEDAR